MITSEKGIELIKSFESLRLKAYKCPSGVWTIGYGHTKDVKATMVISPQRAERLLKEDITQTETQVKKNDILHISNTRTVFGFGVFCLQCRNRSFDGLNTFEESKTKPTRSSNKRRVWQVG